MSINHDSDLPKPGADTAEVGGNGDRVGFFRTTSPSDDQLNVNPILGVIKQFLDDIQSIGYSGPLAVHVIEIAFADAAARQKKFIDEKAKILEENKVGEDGKKHHSIKINSQHGAEFKEIMSEVEKLHLTLNVLPRSLLVTHVSQFDAYIGRLIKAVLLEHPEILSSSESPIGFKELLSFGSIESAKDFVIDKEVDKVLRDNHFEHIKWFEDKVKIRFTDSYDSMAKFVEVCERRNLCVHTDASVSRRYISVCEKHRALPVEAPKVGDRLAVDKSYLQSAARVLLEVGLFVGQRVARKLHKQEKDIDAANTQLIDLAYDLIVQKRYRTASRILEYALSNFSDTTPEKDRLIMKVNLANSFRLLKKDDEVKKVIASEEWGSKADEYRLAAAVLKGDFAAGALLMKKIGQHACPSKHQYRDWPLFSEFRQTEEFLSAYKTVFSEEFYYENAPQKQRNSDGAGTAANRADESKLH